MSGSMIRLRSFIRNIRGFKTNSILRDTKTSESGSSSQPNYSTDYLTPTNFQKRILVYSKKYSSIKDVPDRVPADVMQTAMSKCRIRVANLMMLFTIAGCIVIVTMGKLRKNEKMEEMKTQHDEIRRQITAEYKNSLKQQTDTK
ncbi:UPF0389 protein CG9231 [Microplitis demolitor]|uniref:UPF0389 protein CG9231 n=1 Tax=Microplitis demolitor TaxID=69319 RepID=UPI0004CD1417|nr:UPF0389 protein CG9231 [Microplitis demolitor]XP_014295203.1 UPF0389 protein CG9231 [Microplitis demolitor]XP_014295204.1 UPF0389 protein CG9231 [Microplitis demolitor]